MSGACGSNEVSVNACLGCDKDFKEGDEVCFIVGGVVEESEYGNGLMIQMQEDAENAYHTKCWNKEEEEKDFRIKKLEAAIQAALQLFNIAAGSQHIKGRYEKAISILRKAVPQ